MTTAKEGVPAHMITMITKLATGIDLITDTGGVINSRKKADLWDSPARRIPAVSPMKNPEAIFRNVISIESQNPEVFPSVTRADKASYGPASKMLLWTAIEAPCHNSSQKTIIRTFLNTALFKSLSFKVEVVARHRSAYSLRVGIIKCLKITFEVSSQLIPCDADDIAQRDSSLGDWKSADDALIHYKLGSGPDIIVGK